MIDAKSVIFGIAIIASICAVCACFKAISVMIARGSEYGIRLFKSFSFAILLCAFLVLVFLSDTLKQADHASAAIFFISVYGGAFVVAAFLNIRKSNFLFGLVFTLFQAILPPFFIFGILFVINILKKTFGRPQYN